MSIALYFKNLKPWVVSFYIRLATIKMGYFAFKTWSGYMVGNIRLKILNSKIKFVSRFTKSNKMLKGVYQILLHNISEITIVKGKAFT